MEEIMGRPEDAFTQAERHVREDEEGSMEDQDRIRQRPHEIWEREGRPEGRHAEHWARARREMEAEDSRGASARAAVSDDTPTVTAPGGPEATPAQAAAAADAVGTPRKAETDSPGQAAGADPRGRGPRA